MQGRRVHARVVWLLLAASVLLGAGCDFFRTQFEDSEPAVLYTAKAIAGIPQAARPIVVMDWNVKFAGGRIDFFFDCYGDRVLMTESEVLTHLEGLAAKIRQVDPDILLVQEIDVLSKRTAYVDMVQWLLDHTDLNYGAYASQWKADFIPSDGLGKMDDGVAILSRWPIREASRIALPERADQSALERYFYLKRSILTASIPLPWDPSFHVVNTHLEAYTRDDTKKQQFDLFLAELDRLSALGASFVAGGDLNMIPPGSAKLMDFPDSVCEDEDFQADDYSGEVGWIDPVFERYESATPAADYVGNPGRYYTHTTDRNGFWNRTLDYLFTNATWVDGSNVTHQNGAQGGMETMPLSDHAPISALLEVRR